MDAWLLACGLGLGLGLLVAMSVGFVLTRRVGAAAVRDLRAWLDRR